MLTRDEESDFFELRWCAISWNNHFEWIFTSCCFASVCITSDEFSLYTHSPTRVNNQNEISKRIIVESKQT
jgi:hypothetical protein